MVTVEQLTEIAEAFLEIAKGNLRQDGYLAGGGFIITGQEAPFDMYIMPLDEDKDAWAAQFKREAKKRQASAVVMINDAYVAKTKPDEEFPEHVWQHPDAQEAIVIAARTPDFSLLRTSIYTKDAKTGEYSFEDQSHDDALKLTSRFFDGIWPSEKATTH